MSQVGWHTTLWEGTSVKSWGSLWLEVRFGKRDGISVGGAEWTNGEDLSAMRRRLIPYRRRTTSRRGTVSWTEPFVPHNRSKVRELTGLWKHNYALKYTVGTPETGWGRDVGRTLTPWRRRPHDETIWILVFPTTTINWKVVATAFYCLLSHSPRISSICLFYRFLLTTSKPFS